MRLVCPECHQKLTAKDELNGKRIKCPGCGEPFVASPVDEEEDAGAASPPGRKTSPVTASRRKAAPSRDDDRQGKKRSQEAADEGTQNGEEESQEQDEEEEEAPRAASRGMRRTEPEDERGTKKRKIKRREQETGKKKLYLWLGIGGAGAAAAVITLVLLLGGSNKGDKASPKRPDKDTEPNRSASAELVEKATFKLNSMIEAPGAMHFRSKVSADEQWVVFAYVQEGGELVKNMVRVVDLQGKQAVSIFELPVFGLPPVALSPRKDLLASPGRRTDDTRYAIDLRDPRTGAVVKTLKPEISERHEIEHLVFSSKGDLLLAAAHENVTAWDPRDGKRKFGWKAGKDWIRGMALSSNGETLLTIADNSTIKVWKVSTQAEVRSISLGEGPSHRLALSPDGKVVATLVGNNRRGFAIHLHEVETGNKLKELEDKRFTRDSDFMILNDNRTLMSTGEVEFSVWDIVSGEKKLGKENDKLDKFLPHALAPSGKVVGRTWNWDLKVWELKQ